MLRLKFESGLFENPYPDVATAEAKTATPDAIALAREAAGKADRPAQERQAAAPARPVEDPAAWRCIGTHARDTPIGGYSDVPKHVVSVLEGMQEAAQGPLRRRLCRRRAADRKPLLVVRRGEARPRRR